MRKRSWLAVTTVVVFTAATSVAYGAGSTYSPSQRPGYHKPSGTTHSNTGHNTGHTNHNTGHTNHNTGHTNHNTGHTNHNTGHTNHNTGYTNHNTGYTNHNTGHTNHGTGYTNHGHMPHPGTQDLGFYRALKNDVETAQSHVRSQRLLLATMKLRGIDAALARRPSPFDRRLRASLQGVSRFVHDRRWREAGRRLRAVRGEIDQKIATLGHGGHHSNDVQAHREWIRDIRDLIDTLQDGNIRMARRDLETLIRDVRQDGSPSSFNRQIEQRLRFIARDLNQPRPRVREIVRDLRDVQETLRKAVH